ncbi:MAG: PTPA-CTERM sorting domain-containing protein [Spirulina sp.]
MTGLTQGLQYTVSFWQAAGQQDGFDGDSQSGWTVSFGGASQTSPTMLHPSKAPVSGWQQVTMNFTATSSTEVLSFLATGSPAGQPPFSLLSGVSVSEVPTPALLPGLVGLGVAALRKRKGEGSEEAEE